MNLFINKTKKGNIANTKDNNKKHETINESTKIKDKKSHADFEKKYEKLNYDSSINQFVNLNKVKIVKDYKSFLRDYKMNKYNYD